MRNIFHKNWTIKNVVDVCEVKWQNAKSFIWIEKKEEILIILIKHLRHYAVIFSKLSPSSFIIISWSSSDSNNNIRNRLITEAFHKDFDSWYSWYWAQWLT